MKEAVSMKLAEIEFLVKNGLISKDEIQWLIKTLRDKMAEMCELDRRVIKLCKTIDSVTSEIKSIAK